MTTGPEDYVVLQRKSQLFPAIAVAAYRLRRLPVWHDRTPNDPASAFGALEESVVQATFFGDDDLNAALDDLLAAAAGLVRVIRTIQDSSRPSFGGNVDERHRGDDDAARRRFDDAIAAFVGAARGNLRIS
ncbi:hypothetical protein ILP97_18080 [Amycolatopsis sp. H6(2020)]|nr:hypothetical protein [Amycolatopsis sp. H6(2020)]